jgi:SH3-like domain-containing protein
LSGVLVAAFFLAVMIAATPAHAMAKGPSGLPLPRFVSLKASRVNMRVGPGRDYHVEWLYLKRGLPMEIIQEYDNWRKVRDPDGNEGWILHSLLSGRRTVIIAPWESAGARIPMFGQAVEAAAIKASLEPGVVAELVACGSDFCEISAKGAEGFIPRKKLWGVYPDEKLED